MHFIYFFMYIALFIDYELKLLLCSKSHTFLYHAWRNNLLCLLLCT